MDANSRDSQCVVCRRTILLESEVNEGFEAISICRECKIMVLDGGERSITHQRRRRRGRSSHGSSESIDDLFSQQFSQLISLVRQSHEAQIDGDASIIMQQQRTSYSPAQGRVRRWQRTFSDNESDSLYQTDSLFGETDSNISFGGYGESDASLDVHSLLDREMVIQVDNESHAYTDTDIDPMHAGLDQWNSDDQDDEDGEWEEVDEQIQAVNSPFGYGEREAEGSAWIRWRIQAGLEESEVILPYVGSPGDYLDTRGFEELLEQLAETGSSRRGAPPAAASTVVKLPQVVISEEHEQNGSIVCAVCKDLLPVNTEAKQLPCLHLYHPLCILPWLRTRNSCPVCRFELPTDDQEYEDAKRNTDRNADVESSSDVSSDSEDGRGDRGEEVENIDQVPYVSNREGGARRWLFLAAAPIVSIVGIALVLWFRSPVGDRRIRCGTREHSRQQFQSSRGGSAPSDRNRRAWWSLI